MGYREYPAEASLQDWVKCYWSIEEEPSDHVQDIWPDGCVELFFSSGSIVRINDEGPPSVFPAFGLIGLQTGIMRVRCDTAVRIISARLYPHLGHCWSPGDLSNLNSAVQPLLHRGELESACKSLERWLLQQPRVEDEWTAVLRNLSSAGGDISIAKLASESNTSSRQMQRLFARRLGIAPKLVAQVIRFARGWSEMLAKPDLTLAQLALELGYSDQAHFAKEFKRFSRQSPGQFLKRIP